MESEMEKVMGYHVPNIYAALVVLSEVNSKTDRRDAEARAYFILRDIQAQAKIAADGVENDLSSAGF